MMLLLVQPLGSTSGVLNSQNFTLNSPVGFLDNFELTTYTVYIYSCPGLVMKLEWKKLLSDGIYYSQTSMSFYKAFYFGLGSDDIRELPTQINNYLHQLIDTQSLKRQSNVSGACIGRYRDNYEADEKDFDFDGYFTDLISVNINAENTGSNRLLVKPSIRVNKALMLAAKAHTHQKRKSDNSPYMSHLLEVKDLLINVGNVIDEDIIISGLLHDIIEDSDTMVNELMHQFGSRVSCIVNALTDDKSLKLEVRREKTLVKLESASLSIRLIKLADICSNASAIPAGWSDARLAEYFTWLDAVAEKCRPASEALYQKYLVHRDTI